MAVQMQAGGVTAEWAARGVAHARVLVVAAALGLAPVAAEELPEATRAWEVVPGAIRADGSESFRVEVEVSTPVGRVQLLDVSPCLEAVERFVAELRDDGLAGDRRAGDLVYTSVALRFSSACSVPPFFGGDPESAPGVDLLDVGDVAVEEVDGAVSSFLGRPGVGLVAADVPAPPATALAADVVATPHLVNLQTESRTTQRFLRFPGTDLEPLTARVYAVLPDAFDFLVLLSTGKVELLPMLAPRNFVVGSHRSARVSYTGTGRAPFDGTSAYGSAGRLLGVNALDAANRGLLSKVATHELLHQWVDYLDLRLGLSAPDNLHYDPRSSAASLVGGFRWAERADGTFVLDCTEGAGGAHAAAPLDLYMMGLIGPAAVPPLHVYAGTSPPPVLRCGEVIDDIVHTVTIDDIVARLGPRTPGPADAQRAFALAFVAESHGRLLTPTELAFLETLAGHYTRPLPPDAPAPYHGSAEWASIDRFFGEGTSWRSDVLLCGNGRLEGPEECDDGNLVRGDGCSATCTREAGGVPRRVDVLVLGRMNPRCRRLRVAVLSASDFDARSVLPASVRFGAGEAAPLETRVRDVDRDGDPDLVLVFAAAALHIACGTETLVLTGETGDGQRVAGTAAVRVLGCRR